MRCFQDNSILQACRILFGRERTINHEFLAALQPGGARVAYRQLVKAHHPDRFPDAPKHVRLHQSERFREIHQAYRLLNNFLDGRQTVSSKPAPAPATATGRPPFAPQHHGPATTSGCQPAIPNIPLEFGMYAYYSGKITYQHLVDGLDRQRRQRPPLGDIAVQQGWLTRDQVRSILRQRGHSRRFGKTAVDLGYLRTRQVEALLAHQRSRQQRLGQIFVEKGLMTRTEACRLAHGLEQHNTRLRNAVF